MSDEYQKFMDSFPLFYELKPSDEAKHRLSYHPVTSPGQQARYENNRAMFMMLFDYIQSVGNPSREQSLALTALQESLMWLNAHVACNGVQS